MWHPLSPLGQDTLFGMSVQISPDRPRYTLPAEVLPGVPWPAGFSQDFAAWAGKYLGTVNLLPRGTVYVLGNRTLLMRAEDAARLLQPAVAVAVATRC